MNAPLETPCYEILPPVPHDSVAWHEARRQSIGASEIAVVLGESPWRSRLDLYFEKTSDQPPEFQDHELLRWGRLLEGTIIEEVCRRAEVEVASRGLALRSIAHPWATATPDALLTTGEPVEVKNITHGFDAEAWELGIPRQYYLQCQHQMMVTGASRCLFAALLYGSRLVWEWVERDEDEIRRITVAGAEFWRRVTERDEPPPDGHPRERAALATRATEDAEVELYDSEIGDALADYERLKTERLATEKKAKALKSQEDSCANAVAQFMGPAKRGFTASGWQFRWKESSRKGFTVAPSTTKTFEIKRVKESR